MHCSTPLIIRLSDVPEWEPSLRHLHATDMIHQESATMSNVRNFGP
jgi:hypothetical protein